MGRFGVVASQLIKAYDVFSELLRICGYKTLPYRY